MIWFDKIKDKRILKKDDFSRKNYFSLITFNLNIRILQIVTKIKVKQKSTKETSKLSCYCFEKNGLENF